MPLVRFDSVAEVPVTVTFAPVGIEVTVYEVMALPPSDEGAVQETVACELPAVAETVVGAPGIVIGVTELDGVEAALEPTALVATTVKV